MMLYPEFNVVHPPRVSDRDGQLPVRTEAMIVATMHIGPEQFDHVIDPKYPWQTMRRGSPREFAAAKEMRAKKLASVDHYEVTHGVYWKLLESVKPGNRTTVVRELISESVREAMTRVESFEQSVSQTLGLTVGASIPIEGIPLNVKATSKFTAEFKNALKITQELERTLSREREITQTLQTKENVTYLLWCKQMDLELWRFEKSATERELVKTASFPISDVFIDPVYPDTNEHEEKKES